MAFAVIVALYGVVGLLAAVGSVTIARRFLPGRKEQWFFGLFLTGIASFYLAFAAHFRADSAWTLEAGAAGAFALLGAVGVRLSPALVAGYALHAVWDLCHEAQAHLGANAIPLTEIPLAYGIFCATYDVAMAGYFVARRKHWRAV